MVLPPPPPSRLSGERERAMLSSSLTTAEVPLSKPFAVAECLAAVDSCEIGQIPDIKVKHWRVSLNAY